MHKFNFTYYTNKKLDPLGKTTLFMDYEREKNGEIFSSKY